MNIEQYLRHKVHCHSREVFGGICTCGRDEAAAELAAMQAVIEAAELVINGFEYFGKANGWFELSDGQSALDALAAKLAELDKTK